MRHLLTISLLFFVATPAPAQAQLVPFTPRARNAPGLTAAPTMEVSLLATLNPNSLGAGVRVTRHRNTVAAWEMNLERASSGDDRSINVAVAGRAQWRKNSHPDAGSLFATAGVFATGTLAKVWSPLYGIGFQSDYRDGVAVRVDMQSLPRLCECSRIGIGMVMGF